MTSACHDRHPSPSGAAPLVTEAELTARTATYRFMIENAADLILRFDATRKRIYVSPSVRDILGYDVAELMGRPAETVNGDPKVLIHPDDHPTTNAAFMAVGPAQPRVAIKFRIRHKDGHYVWVEGHYNYLAEDGGVLSVLRDISARKQAEERLAETNAQLEAANRALQAMAHQDGLTGIANRRRFDECLAAEFARSRRDTLPLGLVLIDADQFKAYNDRYGHVSGDDCLHRLSQTIAGALRRPGDLAARYGGEEIVALLPATDEIGVLAVAEQLRAAVAALGIEHGGSEHGIVTISAGACSLIPAGGDKDPQALIAMADRALYQAKAAGRNRVCGGRAGEVALAGATCA